MSADRLRDASGCGHWVQVGQEGCEARYDAYGACVGRAAKWPKRAARLLWTWLAAFDAGVRSGLVGSGLPLLPGQDGTPSKRYVQASMADIGVRGGCVGTGEQ